MLNVAGAPVRTAPQLSPMEGIIYHMKSKSLCKEISLVYKPVHCRQNTVLRCPNLTSLVKLQL